MPLVAMGVIIGRRSAWVKCCGGRSEGPRRGQATGLGGGSRARATLEGGWFRRGGGCGDGGGAGTGPEASRSAKRTLDAPLAKYPVGRGSAVVGVGSETGLGAPHSLANASGRRSLPPGEGGGPGAGPRLGSGTGGGLPLSRRRGRRPCRRRCAGTAPGVRPGRGGRPRGPSPRRRPRRAGRSRCRA